METFIVYIIESSICLTAFYVIYYLAFCKDNGFKFIRFYLLASIIISTLLPLNNFQINFPNSVSTVENTVFSNTAPQSLEKGFVKQDNKISNKSVELTSNTQPVDYTLFIKLIYLIGFLFVLLRFVIGILTLFIYFKHSIKESKGNLVILKSEKFNYSFSCFNFVFVNPNGLSDSEIKSVIAHENIHVSQYHTIDLIMIEFLSAVMWFNPFVWLMRKSLRQVHEYLADEGVLNIGFDRLEYQTLLVNQVAESRLVSLASSFNHSQIKNRILMMTKIKSDNMTKLKLFALIPLTAVLFLTISCINGQNKSDVVTAVEPVRMNVLYIGVDNPIKIAASGYDAAELEVSIVNGVISGKNGEYIIRPKEQGSAIVTVSCNGKEIQKTNFRVKYVPDPVAVVPLSSNKVNKYTKGGEISKNKLLESEGIKAYIENFDFDLRFEMVEFTISCSIDGKNKSSISKNGKFTDDQRAFIEKLKENQKLYIENIKVKGPDGVERTLSPIGFIIKGE